MVFAIELKETEESFRFFVKTKKRLKDKGIFKTPFVKESLIVRRSPGFYIFDLRTYYLPVYFFGFVWIFGSIVFSGFQLNASIIPGIVLTSVSFFWTDDFYYLMIKIGLKKSGYSGEVKRIISKKKIIRRLL